MKNKRILTLPIISLFSIMLLNSVQVSAAPFGSQKTYGSNLQTVKSKWAGAGYRTLPIYLCEDVGATLTGSYTSLPCQPIVFSPTFETAPPGGKLITSFLNKAWWPKIAFPHLQDLSSQLHAFRIGNSQMLGRAIDAQTLNQNSRAQKLLSFKARQRYTPNEYSCVAASNVTSLSKSASTANAMNKGLKKDLNKRSAKANPIIDHADKWTEYCAIFQDPKNNNGMNGCSEEKEGPMPNGDIDIEGILFADTINMMNDDEYKAAKALLVNLAQPDVRFKPVQSSLATVAAKENILKFQHLEAVRNVATNSITDIISRRMSIPANGQNFVKRIRETAGIDSEKISENPSYNELMLALTKERFLDSKYFMKVQKTPDAIRQEQTVVAGYINMQLNDIYKIQEQINILTAARTALRFNADEKPSHIGSSANK